MKAVVTTKYGSADFIELQEVNKPTPRDDEILIQIYATSVTAGDIVIRNLTYPLYPLMWLISRLFYGQKTLRKSVLGHEFAGKIIQTGNSVTRFNEGDAVFGTTSDLSVGSHAEYVCLPQDAIVAIKPKNLSFEEAAVAPVGGLTALFLLDKVDIQPDDRILVYGASGSVGSYVIQLAKSMGAEVTAVCSGGNIDMVKSLGADHVIDYTKQDYTQINKTFDVVFDAVGKTSKSKSKAVLSDNGRFVSIQSATRQTLENLFRLKVLIEADQLHPVIDRVYPLEDIISAHKYVEKGHKRGNVGIRIVPT